MSYSSDTRSSYPSSSSGGGSGTSSTGSSSGTSGSSSKDDTSSLRAELDSLKEQVTAFVTKTSNDAMRSARETTAGYANQMSNKASEFANTATEQAKSLANSATEQAKTLTSELERIGRNNPLGAIAGALLVGVVIGLIGRRH